MSNYENIYTIKSLAEVNEDDIDKILSDSKFHEKKLNELLFLLRLDQVDSISWIRVIDDDKFQLVTQTSAEMLLQYLHSDLWKIDKVTTPHSTISFQIIDYYALDPSKAFSQGLKDHLTLYFTKHFQNMYDHFSIDINKSFYLSLNAAGKELVHERFKIIVDMLYKSIYLKSTFQIHDHKVIFFSEKHTKAQKIKETYQLTDLNLDYLKLIATGNTAKEIALQLEKSPRSVQSTINILYQKLHCDSKQDLINIARIIVSYLQ
ncbi:LuxR C-terminal-related transcriptional regulator [Francisellaceae bacterium]|nr:LuxR C-terminal-related transcriptional regulator [Francisellaceae bacterium]